MKKLCLILAVTISAFSARANTIVFSSFGPSDSFDPNNFLGLGELQGFPFFYTAAQFTAQASGNLATVEFPLSMDQFVLPPPFPAVNVYLYADAAGVPDSAHPILLGTQFVNDQTIITSYTLNVSGIVPVTAGSSYWLALKPADLGEAMLWPLSLPQVSGSVKFTRDGSNWSPPFSTLPAFRVAATSAVPDSGYSLILMLLSLMGLSFIGGRSGFANPLRDDPLS